jgi:hypothetical protein
LGFLDQGPKVPTIASRPIIDPREKLPWIIENFKFDLSSSQWDEQNLEIVSKMEEIEFSTKFA